MYEEQRKQYEERGLPQYVGVSITIRIVMGVYFDTGELEDESYQDAMDLLTDLRAGYTAVRGNFPILIIGADGWTKAGYSGEPPEDLIMLIYDAEAEGFAPKRDVFSSIGPMDPASVSGDTAVAEPPEGKPTDYLGASFQADDEEYIYMKFPKPPPGNNYTFNVNLMGGPVPPPPPDPMAVTAYDLEEMEHVLGTFKFWLGGEGNTTLNDTDYTPPDTGTWAWALWQMQRGRIVKPGSSRSPIKYKLDANGTIVSDVSSERTIKRTGRFVWTPAEITHTNLKARDWIIYIDPTILEA